MLEQRDIDIENALAAQVGAKFSAVHHRFSQYSPVDFWLETNGKVSGFLECRGRTIPIDAYETICVDVTKWLSLVNLRLFSGVPVHFAVKWTDDWGVVEVSSAHLTIVPLERMHREGYSEVLPVVLVPIKQFELL